MSKAETPIAKEIRDALNALPGYEVWRQQSGQVRVKGGWMHLAPEGTGDVIGWTPRGRFLGVEVKVDGARTDPAREKKQREWGDRVTRAGGIHIKATSVADCLAQLGELAGEEWCG